MTAHITEPGDQEFERLLHDGITAAKSDQRSLAQSLLRQAIILNNQDARPYVWLSATTDDLVEQREYLEHAVAVDPTNAAARRSLAILTGKIDPQYMVSEGSPPDYTPPAQLSGIETASAEAQGHSFLCPQCGGQMFSAVQTGLLTCEYCGYVQIEAPGSLAGAAGQVLDFVMPTALGHQWAAKQHRMACERCGAQSLLQAGQKTVQCPYCGSNQMIASTAGDELMDPQEVVVMKFDAQQASKYARTWLGKGIFSPDDLVLAIQHFQLRPAYYSFWSFEGAYEARWSCEVNEGSGDYAHWVPRSGVETRFFKDVLVPGVRALTPEELESIEPFDLKEGVEFKPDYLAGWPTLIYDRSLSDASLLAREKKLKELLDVNRISIRKELLSCVLKERAST
jgi:DNA-directed RNA polymerase subunit RPC12/RpoP